MTWTKLDDQHFTREEKDVARYRHFNAAKAGDEGSLTVQRWKHADGRYAAHVSDADPELLVLGTANAGDDGVVLHEYDLKGRGAEPDSANPLKGAHLVRTVVAPQPLDDDEAWELLRGWS